MKQRCFRNLSLGLLAALTALACILTACPGIDGTPEPKTYTVTFDVDGGSTVPAQTVKEGGKVARPKDNLAKAEHTFAGWYKEAAKTNLWNFDTDTVTANTTIYAKWVLGENVPSYKVTFDADGGAPAPTEQNVLKGEPVEKPADPTKDGNTFDGWYNGNTQWDFATDKVTAAITLKAKWTPTAAATYTVTFDVDGGSEVDAQTVEAGGKVVRPTANPAKTGHTFANWYKDAAKTNLWNFDTDTVTANTTIYAKWVLGENVPSYTVTFNVDGGDPAPAVQNVLKGEPVQEPTKPAKADHIFDGWYNGNTQWDFATDKVTAAITLKAKWTPAVTVTFETNGGSAIDPVTVAKGSTVYLSNYQPTKTGHVFDSWYTDEALKSPAEYQLTVDASIKLYAKWTSTSDLAPYAGVWRSDGGDEAAYWLRDDGTVYQLSSYGSFLKSTWSPSQIAGQTVTFNADKASFSSIDGDGNTYTYTKNTTETRTPTAATGDLQGIWTNGGGGYQNQTVELKADTTAELTSYGNTVTLNYCVETDAVYLLTPTDNLVIVSMSIADGKLGNFSKQTSDAALVGIWKLSEDEQDYYWELDKDGKGTFHALGASLPISFTVTEGKIDGKPYTISSNTLTVTQWGEGDSENVDVALTKVDSVSAGSGAGGDSRLHGSWSITQGDMTVTLTFNSNGVAVQDQSSQSYSVSISISGIWKADSNTLYLYNSSIGSSRGSGGTYTISGSTLTLPNMVFTKQ